MGVNSLPRTVIRQRRGCDLNPGTSAPESSTLTTRLPSGGEACSNTDRLEVVGAMRGTGADGTATVDRTHAAELTHVISTRTLVLYTHTR